MMQWLEDLAGPQYVPAILWTLGALAALVVILIVIRVARGMSSGTFVAGGRNRKTRLAVMDATAVDTHRRLVLVRRDDVEHLLLIGGSNDIVVEQNIRLSTPVKRPAPTEMQLPQAPQPAQQLPVQPQPRPRPLEPVVPSAPLRPILPQPPVVRPQSAPQPAPPPHPVPQSAPLARPVPPPVPVQPRPPENAASRPPPRPAAAMPLPAIAVPPANPNKGNSSSDTLDESLLQELELTLENERSKVPAQRLDANRTEPTLEDEMAKLLGELSSPKK